MRSRYPNKDHYDPAPYSALGEEHRKGADVTRQVIGVIMATRTRPGFMAKRLNVAGLPAPHGGAWTWRDVADAKDKEVAEQARKGIILRSNPRGTCVMRVGPCGSWGRHWG